MNRSGVEGSGRSVRIGYDQASQSYTLTDIRSYTTGYVDGTSSTQVGSSVSFDRSDRVSNAGYRDVYRVETDTTTDEVTLYGNARGRGINATPSVKLSYLSFGQWTHIDTAAGTNRQTYFLFGALTPSDALPKLGTASYGTLVTADMVTTTASSGVTSAPTALAGTASFNVDFATGGVATTLNLLRASDSYNQGTFVGTGTIGAASQFSGTFASSTPFFQTGAFLGGFYGPEAEDMGYAFYLTKYNDGRSGASYSPPTWTYYNGVVVGAKD